MVDQAPFQFNYVRRRLFFFSGKNYILQLTYGVSFLSFNSLVYDFYTAFTFVFSFIFKNSYWFFCLSPLSLKGNFVFLFPMRRCLLNNFLSTPLLFSDVMCLRKNVINPVKSVFLVY